MSRHAQETGFTSSGQIDMSSQRIVDVGNAQDAGDAVNKGQMDDAMPVGAIIAFCGTTGFDTSVWHLCDGTAHGSSALLAVLGSANTPDLRGRFIIAAGQGSGLTNRTHGTTGGAETVTLGVSEMPAHTHGGATGSAGSHSHTTTATTGNESANHTHSTTITTGTESQGHTHHMDFDSQYGGIHTHTTQFSWKVFNQTADSGSGVEGTTAGDPWSQVLYGSALSNGNHYHDIVGDTGGVSQTHTHTGTGTSGSQSANHTHTITNAASSTASDHTHTIASQGGGGAHANMPPFYALTYIIKKA